MPYTIEDYQRHYAWEHLDKLTPEEVMEKFSPEKRLKGIPDYDLADAIPNDLLKKKLASRSGDELKELLRQFGYIS